MKVRHAPRALLIVPVLLAASFSAYPQQSSAAAESSRVDARRKALSYTFISPNTRENLTLEEAVKLLDSTEEARLVDRIHQLSVCLGFKSSVRRAIGSWRDGAEHSTLFRIYTEQSTLRYEDARLGKLEKQKSVLFFRQNSSGAARIYILNLWRRKGSLAAISRTLDQNGVESRTLVPAAHRRTIVYVVDLKDGLRKHIRNAARQLGAKIVTHKGVGEFIGDDSDRDQAQRAFARIITEYEDEHPQIGLKCSLSENHFEE